MRLFPIVCIASGIVLLGLVDWRVACIVGAGLLMACGIVDSIEHDQT